jgi:hypothetical protein
MAARDYDQVVGWLMIEGNADPVRWHEDGRYNEHGLQSIFDLVEETVGPQ